LGKREEALAAAQEAVKLYRALAQKSPDAFNPDLARALGVFGTVLDASGRREEALDSFEEGVRVLEPYCRALPEAYGGLMTFLVEAVKRMKGGSGRV
jgi:tetratricopeptide (TPR) repeat protein